ncbi:hypothetical protein KKF81_06425 [Candidatus Micrarchaeota archaeon]|nr:hypothetical protein [Candidatus Micrarchaeota archaeon]MBU1166564.1 hypothetical protein [Candidatus Micrarchaeota archaeon]MBU1887005.1 hypothetical protein [Candidatus Micrarchaeota archaeon]
MTTTDQIFKNITKQSITEWTAYLHPDNDVRVAAFGEVLEAHKIHELTNLMGMEQDPLLSDLMQHMAKEKALEVYKEQIEQLELRMNYRDLLDIAGFDEPENIANAAKTAANKVARKYAKKKTWGRTDDLKDTHLTFYAKEVYEKITELGEMLTNELFSGNTKSVIKKELWNLIHRLREDIYTEADNAKASHLWMLERIGKDQNMPNDIRTYATEQLLELGRWAALKIKARGKYAELKYFEPETLEHSDIEFASGGIQGGTPVRMPEELKGFAKQLYEPAVENRIVILVERLEKSRTKKDSDEREEDIVYIIKELANFAIDSKNPEKVRRMARKGLEPEITEVATKLNLSVEKIGWLGRNDGELIHNPKTKRPVPESVETSRGTQDRIRRGAGG